MIAPPLSLILLISSLVLVIGEHYENGERGYGVGHGYGVVDYHARPRYKYAYGVHDHHTGDVKQASEHRDGEKVKGEYSLQEPDGGWRTVTYEADSKGFRANVHQSPSQQGHGKR